MDFGCVTEENPSKLFAFVEKVVGVLFSRLLAGG